MSTAIQSEVCSFLDQLGFEAEPSDVCGGPMTFVAGAEAKQKLDPVLAGEKKLVVDSGGSISIS